LSEISVCWNSATAYFVFSPVSLSGERGGNVTLKFQRITSIEIPRETPWGESTHVNEIRHNENCCEIEMQSGDVLRISAGKCCYENG
jgi:hypothetical protein